MGAPPCQRFETSIAKPKQNHNFAELRREEAANSAGGNRRGCQERPRNTENRRGRRASQRVSPAGSPLEGERGSNVFSQHKPKTSFTSALANRWLQHRAHPFTQHVFPLRDSCVFCACFVTLKPGWNAGQQCRRVPPRSIPPPAQNSARREVGRRAQNGLAMSVFRRTTPGKRSAERTMDVLRGASACCRAVLRARPVQRGRRRHELAALPSLVAGFNDAHRAAMAVLIRAPLRRVADGLMAGTAEQRPVAAMEKPS